MCKSPRQLGFVFLLSLAVVSCGGGGGSDDKPSNSVPVNKVPTVNAGSNQSVDETTEVILTGSGADSDGSITNYSWVQVSGANVTISDSSNAESSFTSPITTEILELKFELTVTDNDGATAKDGTVITINPVNLSPTSNAGTDQLVKGLNEVLLQGSGSDSDGNIASYEWTQTSGDEVTLTNSTSEAASFIAPDVTSDKALIFQLIVIDNEGSSGTDNVSITVQTKNNPPVANAGQDVAVNIGTEVILDGSSSIDSDGDVISYTWELFSPEGSYSVLSQSESVLPSFIPDLEGEYTVNLVVNDGKVDSEISTVLVSSAIPAWVKEFSEATNIAESIVIDNCLLNDYLDCNHSYGRNMSLIASIKNNDITLKLASWIGSYTGQYNWLEIDSPDSAPYNELITDMWVVADEKRGIKLYQAPIFDSSYDDNGVEKIIKRSARAVGNSEEIPNAFIEPSSFHITIKDKDGLKSKIASFDESESKGLISLAKLLNERFKGAYSLPITDDQLRAISEVTELEIDYLRSICTGEDNGLSCSVGTNNNGQPKADFHINMTQEPINATGSNYSVSSIYLRFDTDGGFSMYLQYVAKGEVPSTGTLSLGTELGNECLSGVGTAFIVEQETWDSMGYRVQSAWGDKIAVDSTFWACVLDQQSVKLRFDSNVNSTNQVFDDSYLKLSKFSKVFSLLNP
jgi:hypothetical protein